MNEKLRKVRAVVVNALFWGTAWFGIGLGLILIPRFLSGAPVHLLAALFEAFFAAVFGFFLGGAFSLYLIRAFRHSRVEQISAARFALGGALVTMLSVLAIGYILNFEQMTDEVLVQPLQLYGSILQALAFAGGLGGLTAWSTLKLARAGSDRDQLATDGESLGAILAGSAADAPVVGQPNKR